MVLFDSRRSVYQSTYHSRKQYPTRTLARSSTLCFHLLNVEGDTGGHRVVLRLVRVPAVPGGIVLLPVAPQRVGLLAVHRVVADGELLLRHAQRHHQPYDEADDGGGDDVPPHDEQRAHELLEELHAPDPAVEAAPRVGDGEEEGAQGGLRQQAGGRATQEAGDGVGVEDAQGVVHLLQEAGALVHDHHGEPGDAARQHTHHYGSPSLHQT
ncbi:hypothetical protein C4D60_Mb05t27690 [Musa balbisiana]|uniref:Uncharacterized protein n=1 Tax=Musa balbisiana TaxID=52838 RepID=A0A4S8JZA0_MUSBA|nr:hypothetical protein C4D60_Mb05t27690 [Musa balbisiana]